ncbi:MAG TPA: hypothetical protein VGM05_25485 [Planctomycetaceae bacterium]
MDESRVELSVGESMRIDDQLLTVIDIQGDEITFRIDPIADCDAGEQFCGLNSAQRPPR